MDRLCVNPSRGISLSTVDNLLRHPDDQPSIGLILCKTQSRLIAEYALRDVHEPMGAAPWSTGGGHHRVRYFHDSSHNSLYLTAAHTRNIDFWTGDRRLYHAVKDRLPVVCWIGDYRGHG